jgi:hypothetical protein
MLLRISGHQGWLGRHVKKTQVDRASSLTRIANSHIWNACMSLFPNITGGHWAAAASAALHASMGHVSVAPACPRAVAAGPRCRARPRRWGGATGSRAAPPRVAGGPAASPPAPPSRAAPPRGTGARRTAPPPRSRPSHPPPRPRALRAAKPGCVTPLSLRSGAAECVNACHCILSPTLMFNPWFNHVGK